MSEDAFLRPPWKTLGRQHQATTFGMWVFLASEVLLFAGLFAGYAVYRGLYPSGFLAAGRHTDVVFGTVNTALLMTSSFSLATAGRAAKAGLPHAARRLIWVTIAIGMTFLVLKGFEYREDLHKGLFPGLAFPIAIRGAMLFFSFYWIMTGIHALHVTAGLIALSRLQLVSRRNPQWLAGSTSEEATALYWHLVDVIWIVLYPILYLGGRAHG